MGYVDHNKWTLLTAPRVFCTEYVSSIRSFKASYTNLCIGYHLFLERNLGRGRGTGRGCPLRAGVCDDPALLWPNALRRRRANPNRFNRRSKRNGILCVDCQLQFGRSGQVTHLCSGSGSSHSVQLYAFSIPPLTFK